MIGETLLLSLLLAIIAATRKVSGLALGVVIISMLIWPEFLRVPFGLLQLSAPRFVALILLIKFISKGRHRQIKYGKVDKLVILTWLWTIIASVLASAEFSQVAQMIGRGFDTVLMYFIARMAILNSNDIKKLALGLGFIAILMCMAGVYEAITWSSPYHKYSNGSARLDGYSEIRYGMLRAQGSTLVSIYFGMAMMIITGLLWSVRGYIERGFIYKIILTASVLAVLSSLSSGPWIALFTLIALNLYYKRIKLIKPSLYMIAFMSLMLEIISNRHFYNLIDYIAIDSQTAWYRTRLMEIAVNQWSDYWLVGVGSNWPQHWAALLDGRVHIDIVNNFILVALYGGLPALIMFITTHVVAIKYSIKTFRSSSGAAKRQLVFGLSAALLALDLSSMSVGLFGPPLLLSYILLGIIVSVATAWKEPVSKNEPIDFKKRLYK